MDNEDKKFMITFSSVVGVLAVFSLLLIVVAASIGRVITPSENTVAHARTIERIQPAGQVFAGETGRAALAQRAAAQPEPAAAFDGSTDGELIYDRVCAACHDAGIAGSPPMVASVWEDQGRLEQGLDSLVQRAIDGFQGDYGYMPPRGGRNDLTDEQVRASVEYMLESLD